jgi:Esterase-like activity of phytase
VPEFNPTILRAKTKGKAIEILDAIPIVGQSGKPVTGLPNLKDVDEAPYNYSAQELLPLNPNGLDTEVLADPATSEVRVLPKTLVLDLSAIKGMPEKIEGIALLDQNTLAIANDNDFDSEERKSMLTATTSARER